MNDIEKMIWDELQKLHSKDSLRGVDAHAQRLTKDYLSKRRLEIRNGKLTDHNGRLIDLPGDLELLADASPYVGRRSDANERARYTPKYGHPSKEMRQKIYKEMEGILRKLVKLNSVVPLSEDQFNRGLDVISENFVYGYTEHGDQIEDAGGTYRESLGGELVFAQITNGLIGKRRYSFNELMDSMSHLVDHERSGLARELKDAEWKAMARKLIDIDKPKPEHIKEKMNLLKRHELIATIPQKKLPSIPRSEVEKETIRRESLLLGLNPDDVFKGGGQQLANLQRQAKAEYDRLDNATPIVQKIKSFQAPGPAKYEGVAYSDYD